MTATHLSAEHEERLRCLAHALVHQEAARVLVLPNRNAPGFWFGGGNMALAPDGTVWLVGRYRNYGDSRTGLQAGERGLECALFASNDGGRAFTKVRSWSKADLSTPGSTVLSIEGTSLLVAADGRCELFISLEKDTPYPDGLSEYQKPGTGIWSIDVMCADSVEALDPANIRPALDIQPPPEYLHIKDPSVFTDGQGATVMMLCTHPFCWSSANTAVAVRKPGGSVFALTTWQMIERGPAWDVASTRMTNRLAVPRIGAFAALPAVSLYFHDGCECVREHDQNTKAVRRPRGYSCEEIGGACYGLDSEFPTLTRLSPARPMFVSPWGTGCSRYVDTLATEDGIHAVWQQSQQDESQPLVENYLDIDEVRRMLS